MKKYILCICLSFTLFSCRTELNEEEALESNFEVVPNWEDSPTKEDGIVLYLYSIVPPRPVEIHFLPYWGGKLSIPYGKYKATIHSDYNYYINTFNKEDFSSLSAQQSAYNQETLFSELPKNTISSLDKNFYLSDFCEILHEYKTTFKTDLKKQNKKIYLNIKIKGYERLERAQATLSGITNKLNFAKKKLDPKTDNYFLLDFELKSDYLYVAFSSFGLPDQDQTKNVLNFIFQTKDGVIHHKVKLEKDITNRIPNEVRRNGGVVWIDDLDIIIPDLKATNVGFEFPVNDFVDIIEEEIDF